VIFTQRCKPIPPDPSSYTSFGLSVLGRMVPFLQRSGVNIDVHEQSITLQKKGETLKENDPY